MKCQSKAGELQKQFQIAEPFGTFSSFPNCLSWIPPGFFWKRRGHKSPAKLVASPLKFSETPTSYRTAPPQLGEHTTTVLTNAGFSEMEVEELRKKGSLGQIGQVIYSEICYDMRFDVRSDA